MHESFDDVVRVLSQHVPRDEAARAALQTARMLWYRAQRTQESADQLAQQIRPRGDRDLLEQLGRLRGTVEALQDQTHTWLFVAERFGSTDVRWEDYSTEWEPDPGETSRWFRSQDQFPYLPASDYTPPPLSPPPPRQGPLYGLVGQPYPHLVMTQDDEDAAWSWLGHHTDAYDINIGTCPKPAPGVDRLWRSRKLARNPIRERAFKYAMEMAFDAPGADRDGLLDSYPDLAVGVEKAANWKRTTIRVDDQPQIARILRLPHDTLIGLLDLPTAYIVFYGRPLEPSGISLANLP